MCVGGFVIDHSSVWLYESKYAVRILHRCHQHIPCCSIIHSSCLRVCQGLQRVKDQVSHDLRTNFAVCIVSIKRDLECVQKEIPDPSKLSSCDKSIEDLRTIILMISIIIEHFTNLLEEVSRNEFCAARKSLIITNLGCD